MATKRRSGGGWGRLFALGMVVPLCLGIVMLYAFGERLLSGSAAGEALQGPSEVRSGELPRPAEPPRPADVELPRPAELPRPVETVYPRQAAVAVASSPAVNPEPDAEGEEVSQPVAAAAPRNPEPDAEGEEVSQPVAAAAAAAPRNDREKIKYGFYLHVYADPPAVIYQVRSLKKHFPQSPIYVMSDGGHDYSPLCEKEGCIFRLCPPANDRWHPWPFFRRLYDAAVSMGTEYVIMLEPDNTVHGPIKRPPTADAGGLLVTGRGFGMGRYVERLARERVPGFKWTQKSMSSGLCGGAYFRTEAILDALSDESMMRLDWNYLGDKGSKEIFSSDFAMQYAFAARGWNIEPWIESAQMDKKKDEPLTGAKDSSFRHYCSCYPGGKPTYNLKLDPKDKKLFKESPYEMTSGPYSSSVCQVCYNHTQYVKLWGSDRCTNSIPFHLSEKLLKRHHPDLSHQPCNLPWLCEPGKPRGHGVDSSEPTAAPVDPKAVFTLLDDATDKCPKGMKALEDVAWCKAAAEQLGKKLAYEEDLYQENDPKGCVYRTPDKDIFFNAAEEGKQNGNRRLICREA